jgi:hypothetical protein
LTASRNYDYSAVMNFSVPDEKEARAAFGKGKRRRR